MFFGNLRADQIEQNDKRFKKCFTLRVMNLQEFNLRRVRLTYPNDIEEYYNRQSCHIPGTPKIYVNSHNQHLLSVYVQKFGETFSPHLWKIYNENTLLDKFESIVITVIKLKNKYGCFGINQNLIRATHNQSIKVWIHQDPTFNYRQFPLVSDINSESIMIGGLIKLFQSLLKQFYNLIIPDSLQAFHLQVIRLKESIKISKRIPVQRLYHPGRKSIKSFIQIPILKPSSVQYTPVTEDSYLSESSHKSGRNTHKCSYEIPKNDQSSFENPLRKFYNETPKRVRTKAINFTYSSPQSKKIYEQPKPSLILSPIREYHETLEHSFPKILINQYQEFQIKQKDFGKPKFPHSTQSTLVTLKDTKSFKDMNFDIPIQQDQKSQSNHKESSKGKSVGESRCDIENQLQNLFICEKENSNNQEQFTRRQLQFEGILFS